MLFNGKSIKIISGVSSSAMLFCSTSIGINTCFGKGTDISKIREKITEIEKKIKSKELYLKLGYTYDLSEKSGKAVRLEDEIERLKRELSNLKNEEEEYLRENEEEEGRRKKEDQKKAYKIFVDKLANGLIKTCEFVDINKRNLKIEIELEAAKFSEGVKELEDYSKIKAVDKYYKNFKEIANKMKEFFEKYSYENKKVWEEKVSELENKLKGFSENIKNIDRAQCENEILDLEKEVESLKIINKELRSKFAVAKDIYFVTNFLEKGYSYYLKPEYKDVGENIADIETRELARKAWRCYKHPEPEEKIKGEKRFKSIRLHRLYSSDEDYSILKMKCFFEANNEKSYTRDAFGNPALGHKDFLRYVLFRNDVCDNLSKDGDFAFDYRGGGIDHYIERKERKIRELKEKIDEKYLSNNLEEAKRPFELIKSCRKNIEELLKEIKCVSIKEFDKYKEDLVSILSEFLEKTEGGFVDKFFEDKKQGLTMSRIKQFDTKVNNIFKEFYNSERGEYSACEIMEKGVDFSIDKKIEELKECRAKIKRLSEELKSLDNSQNLDIQKVLSYEFEKI